jgi:hypothetical protein
MTDVIRNKEVRDKLGVPITPGVFIAYGHALGRCAGLRIGKVLAVKEREKTYGNDNGVSITVWGVDDEWEGLYDSVSLCKSKGTLMFPSRIVVIPRKGIPKEYLALLDPITENSTKKNTVIPKRKMVNRRYVQDV